MGCTPLQLAAFEGQVACVVALCERGANKEAKQEVRRTLPATHAARTFCTSAA
jgi:ankyrin repeat protein